MNSIKPAISREYGFAIKQERGKVTYDALIDTGFRMLERCDLQDISIADLVREAGYSVGAFYARFRSKDEFFEALLARHLQIRTATQKQLFATLPRDTLLDILIRNVVDYYWAHRRFWCAVLVRSQRDAVIWESICNHGEEFSNRFILRMQNEINRGLDAREKTSISFAFQMLLSTINCTIINQPGPLFMGQSVFVDELSRAFRLIAGVDQLLEQAVPARRIKMADAGYQHKPASD